LKKPVIAVCGKGGTGKTVISALLGKSLMSLGLEPMLLIDADPAGGLIGAIGGRVDSTLSEAREKVIAAARSAGADEKERVAQSFDYFVLAALTEEKNHGLLAMGHPKSEGCYCPANKLLRDAIDAVSDKYRAVLIDAEAGLEQVNRQVTRSVNCFVGVVDGSMRSIYALRQIAGLVKGTRLYVVGNRVEPGWEAQAPEGAEFLGSVPSDSTVRTMDREGRSLWEMPETAPAAVAVRDIALKILKGLQ
jgi:CO dehydrogenase maturation factor